MMNESHGEVQEFEARLRRKWTQPDPKNEAPRPTGPVGSTEGAIAAEPARPVPTPPSKG